MLSPTFGSGSRDTQTEANAWTTLSKVQDFIYGVVTTNRPPSAENQDYVPKSILFILACLLMGQEMTVWLQKIRPTRCLSKAVSDKSIPSIFKQATITTPLILCMQQASPRRDCLVTVACDEAFVRLYTGMGHRYWIAQANAMYRTPDWKLHFSVLFDDIPKAWEIIAEVFITKGCLSGMKAEIGKARPEFQRGREITVYIYRYSKAYAGARFTHLDDDSDNHPQLPSPPSTSTPTTPTTPPKHLTLSDEYEQSPRFWLQFAQECETRLTENSIKPAGLAQGDRRLVLDSGIESNYCSYRNEAFIPLKAAQSVLHNTNQVEFYGKYPPIAGHVYPPNASGYNAAKHTDPFSPDDVADEREGMCLLIVAVLVFLCSILLVFILKKGKVKSLP
ncbi:hypothetical protein Pelo_9981 [Pelomyxa schiedti]|nr:hypothetical protein Pelo_9981 [Pelomyxa schiedti]